MAFVGDSGQGDEIVGRGLLGAPGSYDDPVVFLGGVAGVFIHALDAPANEPFTRGFAPPPDLPRSTPRTQVFNLMELFLFHPCVCVCVSFLPLSFSLLLPFHFIGKGTFGFARMRALPSKRGGGAG